MIQCLPVIVSEGELTTATRERAYTADDVWQMTCAADNEVNRYTLKDRELTISMSPGYLHSSAASELARQIGNNVLERDLADVTVESGHHPPQDRRTLFVPDVAFIRKERAPAPDLESFAPLMPALAAEIISPSQNLEDARRKTRPFIGAAR